MTGVDELIGAPVYSGNVLPEWIDVNDHMNVAYYVLAFDYGVDALWTRFGITDDYIASGSGSTFAVESHVRYLRELRVGEPYVVTAQLLGYDDKRIHQFQRMYHGTEGYLAATAEWLNLHVSLATRRVAPWPEVILQNMRRVADDQAGQMRPAELCGKMRLKNPHYLLAEDDAHAE